MRIISKNLNKPLILFSFLIYAFSLIIGFFISNEVQVTFDNDKELSSAPFYDYLTHNIRACLYIMSGLVLFSIPTLCTLLLNGIMLGTTFTGVSKEKSILEAVASIFSHGIFEIPAILLSGAIGLYPLYMFYLLLSNKKVFEFKKHLKKIATMFILVLFLITIASIMESEISPIFVNFFEV